MFFVDTVESSMFGHDLHEISKLHMQSRDPIDPKAADVSIWVKEKGVKLSDFATLQLLHESALLATNDMEILYGLQYFRIRVAENSRLTCLSLLLASRDLLLKLLR